MFNFLKDLPNIHVYMAVWGLSAYWLKKNKHNMATLYVGLGVLLWVVCATSYVPKKLIHGIEKKYAPIGLKQLNTSKTYYIYVLGSGTALDTRLPASMNLDPITLTRLVEGIRIYKILNDAILVTSAATREGLKSQAKISKEAAVSLGVPENHIKMLETPTTTLEEAKAFHEHFGTDKQVILVTSALHMPRAVEIFKDQGIEVIPAPTDYQYKKGGNSYNGVSFPSFSSIQLMDKYQTTLLKYWYYKLFFK